MDARQAAPLVEGCVPGEPVQAEEALPSWLAEHLDLILDKLNAQLQRDLGTDEYRLAWGTPATQE